MIAYLNGILTACSSEAAFIEVAGIGYEVLMPHSSLSKLPEINSTVRILTYLHVSENGLTLFGFLTEEEKTLFEQLITVSGVGPKVALSALSTFSPQGLIDAVAAQDTALVARIPGVGKKTASRIILELKDAFEQEFTKTSDSGENLNAAMSKDAGVKGATEALLSMGFTLTEADLALKDAPLGASEATLLQYALKRLGS